MQLGQNKLFKHVSFDTTSLTFHRPNREKAWEIDQYGQQSIGRSQCNAATHCVMQISSANINPAGNIVTVSSLDSFSNMCNTREHKHELSIHLSLISNMIKSI